MKNCIFSFLELFKKKSRNEGLQIIPTDKNRNEILCTGIFLYEIEEIIMNLTVRNYSSGPEPDRDAEGDVWIFGYWNEKELIYIKLKLDDKAKVISFHSAEHKMDFPFEDKQDSTMKKFYCGHCDCRVDSKVVTRTLALEVKGDSIEITTKVRICNDCSNECYDRELEQILFEKAYSVYRQRHNIIFPKEIESLREKYGLSQRSLAALLGWGTITIHRYEVGSLPDDAHNLMLKMLCDPENFKSVFEQNKSRLPNRMRLQIEQKLEGMGKMGKYNSNGLISPQEKVEPGIETGNMRFSEEIFEQMVLFFAQSGGVIKTKLMKLLFYADFLHYALTTVSISGTRYAHLPHGPAPDDYQYYLAEMKLNDLIDIQETMVGRFPGEKIIAHQKPDLGSLPKSAQKVLKAVKRHFKNYTAKDISDLSHKEPAYTETKQGKPISYDYAHKLKVKI